MKPKIFRPLERDIQRSILDYLKYKGIFHFRVNTGGIMRQGRWTNSPNTTKGVSDIIAVMPCKFALEGGTIVAIEVKRPGEKPSIDQLAFLAAIEKNGGYALVAYSLQDARDFFE